MGLEVAVGYLCRDVYEFMSRVVILLHVVLQQERLYLSAKVISRIYCHVCV